MDCIEGQHCGRGEPNPDGTPTICLLASRWEPSPLDGDEEEDWQEQMSDADFFNLVEGY